MSEVLNYNHYKNIDISKNTNALLNIIVLVYRLNKLTYKNLDINMLLEKVFFYIYCFASVFVFKLL